MGEDDVAARVEPDLVHIIHSHAVLVATTHGQASACPNSPTPVGHVGLEYYYYYYHY